MGEETSVQELLAVDLEATLEAIQITEEKKQKRRKRIKIIVLVLILIGGIAVCISYQTCQNYKQVQQDQRQSQMWSDILEFYSGTYEAQYENKRCVIEVEANYNDSIDEMTLKIGKNSETKQYLSISGYYFFETFQAKSKMGEIKLVDNYQGYTATLEFVGGDIVYSLCNSDGKEVDYLRFIKTVLEN